MGTKIEKEHFYIADKDDKLSLFYGGLLRPQEFDSYRRARRIADELKQKGSKGPEETRLKWQVYRITVETTD